MSKRINLGRVVGRDATINGVNALTLEGSGPVNVTQSGTTVTLSVSEAVSGGASGLMTGAEKQKLAGIPSVDAALSNTSTNPVQNKAVKAALDAKQDTMTVDSAISGSSTNPVQNKAVSAALDGKQAKLTGNVTQLVGFDAEGNACPVNTIQSTGEVFGFEMDLDEGAPASKITYLGTNASYTSAKMGASEFDYGSWADAWFVSGIKPVMLNYDGTVAYELDKNDYTKKADGSDSDIADTAFAGNAMVGIPTVWVKVDVSNPRRPKFYFAKYKVDESFHAYAHTDANGAIMPYTYMPIYNGVNINNKLRSLSGQTITASAQGSGTDQITWAKANNPSGENIWDIEVLADRELINMLLILMGKSTNTQAVFGFGNDNGYNTKKSATGYNANGVLDTGSMNDKGLFWGSTTDHTLGVKVFGMENWWGNVWRRCQGMLLVNGNMKVKLTVGRADGSTTIGYNATGEGYIDLGLAPSGGSVYNNEPGVAYQGFIKEMVANQYGLFPSVMGASDSTQFCDNMWIRKTAVRFALFGAHSTGGSHVGAFASYLSGGVSVSDWAFGAAPSCKPKVA